MSAEDEKVRESAWQSSLSEAGCQSASHQPLSPDYALKGAKPQQPERVALSFRNLTVLGSTGPADHQKTVLNGITSLATSLIRRLAGTHRRDVRILHRIDGVVPAGSMLLVLGRPGSGCTTLLKTLSGEVRGLSVEDVEIAITYGGIKPSQMWTQNRGDTMYMAETDVHFPQMTVEQTLLFAAKARRPGPPKPDSLGEGPPERAAAVAASLGLDGVLQTNVGNDFVRGVSGGERKRVSIAEALLSGAAVQCWDNSTRGLDSANAIEFCRIIRKETDVKGCTACIALYQAPQAAYEMFDQVTLLYEGRQIFFGPCDEAVSYFMSLGFEPAPRQTTPDFLTSVTSGERRVRAGFESKVPRSPDDFVQCWESSSSYTRLTKAIQSSRTIHTGEAERSSLSKGSEHVLETTTQSQDVQSGNSPYSLSFPEQVKLCTHRGFQRLRRDASITITGIIVNSVMALVVGSVFYNLDQSTDNMYRRGVLLFFAILLNAFASAMEILLLYAQRPIVEKQTRYAFYRPSAEAIASMICDMPYKIGNTIFFNLVLYFMTNLRRTPSAFFIFLLFSFVTTLVMSMLYRTFGAASRTMVQALAPVAIIIIALIMYTGFVVPPTGMVSWFRWVNYVDPIAYAFESLMINEFWDREFDCSAFIPQGDAYQNTSPLSRACNIVGAKAGSSKVQGEDYLRLSFGYEKAHLWRNFGILLVFLFGYLTTYLLASEYITAKKPKGDVLTFLKPSRPSRSKISDVESSSVSLSALQSKSGTDTPEGAVIDRHSAVFHWRDVCFDITVNKESRRILDHVDGWIKPGTLTALMGPSGAGKTTLLDVLATRNTIGVVSGDVFVDGRLRDTSFQRKTGYVQQNDYHLATATVREALQFSALMRQPAATSRASKLSYVEEVLKLLQMEAYAEAVVGVPGDGLNVEQRKRLTIGVELAARPQLLVFLDEPTSGLDSQTAWSILDLLTTLKAHGQAVFCTIHQPSGPLFERFDRLLFLAPEGKPVYFGDIGHGGQIMIDYFQRNGAPECPSDGNPAEWLMDTVGCAPGSENKVDWSRTWRDSPELAAVHTELHRLETGTLERTSNEAMADHRSNSAKHREYAASWTTQFWECFKRVNVQYWRSPSYLYPKIALVGITGLFLGLTFYKADNTLQGLRNQTFSIFLLILIFPTFVPQILPNIVAQRDLFEARERPSKTYLWTVFLLSNMLTELIWNSAMALLSFAVWYFPTGYYLNFHSQEEVAQRGASMFFAVWVFFAFTTKFAHLVQAGIGDEEQAGNAANALFTFSLVFCGVVAAPSVLPGFWIFMYRLSPFTYLVSAVLSIALSHTSVRCADVELLRFQPASGKSCAAYMEPFIMANGGYLVAGVDASGNCQYCPLSETDVFLKSIGIEWDQRWRNIGILAAYAVFNALAAMGLYWLARVPKKQGKRAKMQSSAM